MSTSSGHGGTNVLPPICIYFSENFSPSHIKLTDNNPHKGLKPVERPELEKSKLDRKIFSSWKKKVLVRGIGTHDLIRTLLLSNLIHTQEVVRVNSWSIFENYNQKYSKKA